MRLYAGWGTAGLGLGFGVLGLQACSLGIRDKGFRMFQGFGEALKSDLKETLQTDDNCKGVHLDDGTLAAAAAAAAPRTFLPTTE